MTLNFSLYTFLDSRYSDTFAIICVHGLFKIKLLFANFGSKCVNETHWKLQNSLKIY
jgi:hypothetical protein